MPDRLMLALDEFESGQWALDFTAGIARQLGADVWVLHLRQAGHSARVVSIESPTDARDLVIDALAALSAVGVKAGGRALTVPREHFARAISREAAAQECDCVVLGSRRLRGLSRLASRRVRDQVARATGLPLLVAPAPLVNGVHSPGGLQGDTVGTRKRRSQRRSRRGRRSVHG